MLDLLAWKALDQMTAAGVTVRLSSDLDGFTVNGIEKAPQWDEYLTERRNEVLFYLIRKNPRAWQAWCAGKIVEESPEK